MATERRRLYRSKDAVISGVCAGIAEYFDIDPVIARILAVLLTVCSFGIAALVYAVLWLVLPCRVDASSPIACDVRPHAAREESQPVRPRPGSRPIPPVGHEAYAAYAQTAPIHQAGASVFAARQQAASRAVEAAHREACGGMSGVTRLCVWLGVLLLSIGAAAFLSSCIIGVEWWQMWPCLIVLVGVVKMAVPARRTSRIRRFSHGLAFVWVGAVVLFCAMHLLSWSTLWLTLVKMWPMLLVIAGVGIISRALGNEMLALVEALCVVIMCVCALTVFSVPGQLEYVIVQLPFSYERMYDINPWL